MYVTFVLSNLNKGGGTRIVYQRVNELSSRGHDVTIVHSKVPPFLRDLVRTKTPTEFVKKGIQSLLPSDDVERAVDAEFRSVPWLTPRLAGQWSDRFPDADVVVAANWRATHALGALPASKGVPASFVLDYEVWDLWSSDACWEAATELADSPAEVYLTMAEVEPDDAHLSRQKRLVDEALNSDSRKFVLCPWLQELLEEKLDTDVDAVLPPGIDRDVFHPDDAPPESISMDDSFTVLIPSRAPKYKGTTDAIQAADAVRSHLPDAHFVIYGWERPDVPSWVESAGWIDDDTELRRLYSNADVFVSPSYLEGWGLPATEAAACGTAVLGTDTGWIRDYADDDTVKIVPPRDREALQKGLLKLYEDDAYRESLAENGYELVSESFTIPKTVDTFESVLEGIIAERPRH